MPVPLLNHLILEGIPGWFDPWNTVKLIAVLSVLAVVKWYSMGASNTSERQMHSKVVMITGGTTGIGAAVAYNLAKRGAQIILLTSQSPSDIFLVDYIEDLRTRTNNELIYAEQVDLSSTHSIRKFATKWIDNAPPRRLDMIILCAATLTPPGKPKRMTSEGLEETWMVNYLSNFHLLSILSPAIRAQPADRDVRILFSTCPSYISSPPLPTANSASARKPTSGKAAKSSTATGASNATTTIESLALGTDPDFSPSNAYARSKLALLTFGHAFQKHLSSYKRPDGLPPNARVIFVDPGYTRTPGMRRYLSRGTLWGLALYLLLWQNIWFLLKSSEQGAQSFLFAAMEAGLGRGEGGRLVKECMEVDFARGDVKDEKVAEHLWKESERIIERVEREEAVKRALVKKEKEAKEKSEKVVEVVEEEAPKKPSRRTKKKAAEVLADL